MRKKSIFRPLGSIRDDFRDELAAGSGRKPRHRSSPADSTFEGPADSALFLLGLASELTRSGEAGIPSGEASSLCADFLDGGILSGRDIEISTGRNKLFGLAASWFRDQRFELDLSTVFHALHDFLKQDRHVADPRKAASSRKKHGSYMTPPQIAGILLESAAELMISGPLPGDAGSERDSAAFGSGSAPNVSGTGFDGAGPERGDPESFDTAPAPGASGSRSGAGPEPGSEPGPEPGPTLLDPAVGNGVFLLRAAGGSPGILGGSSRDAIARLYGADIDPDAVLATRILLYLQARADEKRGLAATLRRNIILADFLRHAPFQGAGFDYIVGNPPYLDGRRLSPADRRFFRERFLTAAGKINTAALFLEESLKRGNVVSLLLPEPILKNSRYTPVREFLLESARISSICLFGFGRFAGAGVSAIGVTCGPPRLEVAGGSSIRSPRMEVAGGASIVPPQMESPARSSILVRRFHENREVGSHRVSQAFFQQFEESPILVGANDMEISLLRTIESRCGRLGDVCTIRDGISTGFSPFPDLLLGERKGECFVSGDGGKMSFDESIHVPVIDGGEFDRYSPVKWKGRYIRYEKKLEKEPVPPPGRSFNCQLRDRRIFETAPRIISRQTSGFIRATIIKEPLFTRNSIHNILPKRNIPDLTLEFILGVLNSAPLNYYYRLRFQETGALMPQVHIAHLKKLPIPVKGLSGEISGRVTMLVRRYMSGGDRRLQGAIDRIVARLMGVPEGWGEP